jgi:hypothetical protein
MLKFEELRQSAGNRKAIILHHGGPAGTFAFGVQFGKIIYKGKN